jgi:hypothetical protein
MEYHAAGSRWTPVTSKITRAFAGHRWCINHNSAGKFYRRYDFDDVANEFVAYTDRKVYFYFELPQDATLFALSFV